MSRFFATPMRSHPTDASPISIPFRPPKIVRLYRFEKASSEIPPVLPFSKGGELWGDPRWKNPLFLLLEKRKGDFGIYGLARSKNGFLPLDDKGIPIIRLASGR